MSGDATLDTSEITAVTDQVINAAEGLAATLRHSSRNLETATELLLMLLAEQPAKADERDPG